MDKVKWSILLSLMITLISLDLSAQEIEEFDKRDFLKTVELKGELLVSKNLALPSRISVSQETNTLFISDSKSEQLVNIFDLKVGNYIGSFVRKGMGPGELQSANDVEIFPKQDLVIVNGSFQRRLDFYKLSEVLKGVSPTPERTLKFKSFQTNAPKYLGNEQFLDLNATRLGNAASRFNLLSSEGRIISSHGSFPDMELPRNLQNQKSEIFYAFLGVNNELSHFVVAHGFTDIIEIYDKDFKLLHRIQGPEGFNPSAAQVKIGSNASMVAPTEGSRMAFTLPVVGNEEFYVLYNGEPASNGGYHQTKIMSFDLSGKPLNIYNLDIPIFAFDIDWEANVLYGLTHEAPFEDAEVAVVKFQLPIN